MAARQQLVLALAEKISRDLKLAGLPISGKATDGTRYACIADMWTAQLALRARHSDSDDSPGELSDAESLTKPTDWYSNAYEYWEDSENCPCTVSGVLGGYDSLSPGDLSASLRFLAQIRSLKPALQLNHAADCGAGIGRISKGLLLPLFDTVDLIEQSPRLLAAAPKYIGKQLRDGANCICLGLQE